MNGKPYMVTMVGEISVDTTVAVIAQSEEEAAKRAQTECSVIRHVGCTTNFFVMIR